MRINIEDVLEAVRIRSLINSKDLKDIEFYKEGIPVRIDLTVLEEWDFTGLHNIDFITMSDWSK